MSNERGKQTLNHAKALRVSLATSSALALVLAMGPVPYDAEQGLFSYPAAHADSSCFLPGTRVRMADGRLKPIEEVHQGEWVMGLNGRANRVVGIERVPLGSRRLYGFNGAPAFVTAEHPFWTPGGWKSIEPAMTARENRNLPVQALTVGDDLAIWADGRTVSEGNTALDIDPLQALQFVMLEQIEEVEAAADTTVYNLLLDGDHTYFADGFAVHNKGGDGGEGGDGGGSEGGEGGDGGGSEGGEGGDGGGSEGGEGGDGGDSEGGEGGEGGDSEGGDDGGEGGESGDDGSEGGERGDDSEESGERGDRDDGNEAEHEAGERGERGEDGGGQGRGRGRGDHAASGEQGERGRLAGGLAGDVSPEGGDLSASEEAAAIAGGWSSQ